MQLPNQWLWDMVDEFVYQFQSFCQYRAKMKNKTEQEIALLRQFDQVMLSFGFGLFYIFLFSFHYSLFCGFNIGSSGVVYWVMMLRWQITNLGFGWY